MGGRSSCRQVGLMRPPDDDVADAVRPRKFQDGVDDGIDGPRARRRTTSAPSSRARSMLASRCRCASASMRSGASCGVSTKTTNQSVLRRPARREPLRTSVAARGDADDRQTITRVLWPTRSWPAAGVPVGGAPRAGALDALGDLAQRQLAQVAQVRVLEEVLQRPADLVGAVDLAGAQPFLQVLDGQIQVDDLVGLLEEAVGHGLADGDARDALDDVLEALEVLHVERADHVDAGVQQLEDVLVPLAVVAARNVRVRQLVDDDDLRACA